MAVVCTPNVFVRDELERRYLELLNTVFENILGYAVEVQVLIQGYRPYMDRQMIRVA